MKIIFPAKMNGENKQNDSHGADRQCSRIIFEVINMLENLFSELINKYGDDFNWIEVKRDCFINELNLEMNKNHPLYSRAKMAVAKCESNDDVLFLLDNGDLAIVHLTYSTSNADGFLKYKYFLDFQSTIKYIEQEFVTVFL